MSLDGETIGPPLAGENRFCVDSIRTRASACALTRQRDVDGHLVAVEVRVEHVADQRVNLDGLAVDQDRLERLDTQAVQGRARGSAAPDAP